MPAALLFLVLCLLAAQRASAFGRRGGRDRGGWRARGGADGANDDGAAAPSPPTPDEKAEAAAGGPSPQLEEATRLYQKLRGWDSHMSRMTPSQRAQFEALRPADVAKAKEARERLDTLIEGHPELGGPARLHNVCQRLTWDSLADDHLRAAAAFRDGRVKLPEMYQKRIDRACDEIARGLRGGTGATRLLEVGCSCGSLVPGLVAAGVAPAQIHGVDISPAMIRGARALYGGPSGPTFEAADFVHDYGGGDGDGRFDVVVFSSSLHNMPDMDAALRRARSLLRKGGRIVVLHPQGASEILLQVRSDPVLVRRPMPTAAELRTMVGDLELLVEPAEPDSPEEEEHGYLAVLQMKKMK